MTRVHLGRHGAVMRILLGMAWDGFMSGFMNVLVSLKVTGHGRRRLPLHRQGRE